MIAFIGVRISWLIAARKALLAAFAVSASSRASCAVAYRRALSSAIEASWAKRCRRSTLGGLERPLVRAVAGETQRADHLRARRERYRHERADAAVRDRLGAVLPCVVIVDHERFACRPDAAGESFASTHATADIVLEDAGRDLSFDLLRTRPSDVDVAVLGADQVARAFE